MGWNEKAKYFMFFAETNNSNNLGYQTKHSNLPLISRKEIWKIHKILRSLLIDLIEDDIARCFFENVFI